MPVYVFTCQNCRTDFDKLFRTFAAAAEQEQSTPCPHCGAAETRRRVTSVSILKGASPGVGRAAYPTSWRQANAGDPETIKYWKKRVERDMHQEARDPGLKVERELSANRQWNEYLTRGLSGRETAQATEALAAAAGVVDGSHEGHDHAHPHPHPHPHGTEITAPPGDSPKGPTSGTTSPSTPM